MANSSTVGLLKVVLAADSAAFNSAMGKSSDLAQEFARSGQKLADSLKVSHQKIVLGAHAVVEAMGQMDGQFKLTGAEAQRWQAKISTAMDVLKAEGKPVEQSFLNAHAALQKISAEATPAQSSLSKLGAEIRSTAVGFATGLLSVQAFEIGGRKLVQFLGESVSAYLEADKVQKQLVTALTSQGTAIPAVISQYDALANKYQDLTVNSDEAIKGVEALLVEVGGVLPSEMDKAIGAVADLSSGLGIDLRSATMMVAKSFEDNFGALKKAGVNIDEARAKAEGMVYVLDQINQRFGGQAAAEASSYAGGIKQLENAWDNLKEEIGRTIVMTGDAHIAFALLGAGIKAETQKIAEAGAILASIPGLADMAKSRWNSSTFIADWALNSAVAIAKMNGELAKADRLAKGIFTPEEKKKLDEAEAALRKKLADQKKLDEEKAAVEATKKALKSAADAYERKIQEGVSRLTGDTARADLKEFTAEVERTIKRGGIAAAELPGVVKRIREFAAAGLTLPPILQKIADQNEYVFNDEAAKRAESFMHRLENATAPAAAMMIQFAGALQEVSDTGLALPRDFLRGFVPSSGFALGPNPGVNLGSAPPAVWRDFGSSLRRQLASAAAEFPRVLASAVLHGQDIAQALRATVVGLGGDIGADIGKRIAVSTGLTAKLGGSLSSMLSGGLSAAISIGIDLLMKGLKKAVDYIAGNNTKTAREGLAKSLGLDSLAALYEKLGQMGEIGQKLQDIGMHKIGRNDTAGNAMWMKQVTQFMKDFDASLNNAATGLAALGKTAPNALRPLVQELLKSTSLTADLRTQLEALLEEPKWQDLQQQAEELGVSLDSLGAGFQQDKLNSLADKYATFFKNAVDQGGDAQGILAGMTDEITEIITQAQKFGLKLPEFMRPMLEQMAKAGQLLDANGNRLEDLSSFSFVNVESSFDRMANYLKEIRDLLAGIGPAASNATSALEGMGQTTGWSGMFGAGGGAQSQGMGHSSLPGFAAGTMGRLLNFGSGTPVMLHGWEGVYTAADVGGGARSTQIVLTIDGRSIGRAIVPHIPTEVERLGLARG